MSNLSIDNLDVYIESFGFGHLAAPQVDMVFDLRDWFRDPHVSPELRQMDGLNQKVVDAVLYTDGVLEFIDSLTTLVAGQATLGVRAVQVAFGCVGGRHRSVVIAEKLGQRLAACGLTVQVYHRDITKPVLSGTQRK